MAQHWCTQGDGIFLNELTWKEDVETGDIYELIDEYKAPEELEEVAYHLICQYDDEEGHAYLIPYTSRIDRAEGVKCFTSLEMAKVIYDILKDYLDEAETVETIAGKIDYVELWGYC